MNQEIRPELHRLTALGFELDGHRNTVDAQASEQLLHRQATLFVEFDGAVVKQLSRPSKEAVSMPFSADRSLLTKAALDAQRTVSHGHQVRQEHNVLDVFKQTVRFMENKLGLKSTV